MCSNKWDDLKKRWSCWKHLLSFSGLGFHPHTRVIDMPQNWWDERIRENKMAKVFQHIRLEREDDLNYIFAKMEPVNIGPTEDGGHEGGRAGAPSVYLDCDNSDESEGAREMQQFSAPPSQPMRTNSVPSASSGKRRSNEGANDSMVEGFKTFYQEVSEWKKQKQTSNESKKAEEDVEYETLLRELLDGGVDPESEEYFMATAVLVDTTRRAAYRPLPTMKAKLTWIKRAYLMLIGQPPTF